LKPKAADSHGLKPRRRLPAIPIRIRLDAMLCIESANK
jgi:hypothetical protein